MAASSARRRPGVDAGIDADHVLVHVGADALVGVDQPSGPLVADLAVVEILQLVPHRQVVLLLWLCIRVGLGNLLVQPGVQGVVLALAEQHRRLLGRRVALVERVVHPAVLEAVPGLQLVLVELLGTVVTEGVVGVVTHGFSLPSAWARPTPTRHKVRLPGRLVRSVAVTTPDLASRTSTRAAAYVRSPSGIYAVVMALFCGLLLISNVAATKLITVVDGLPAWLGGGIFTDGGALLFPLTYILGDVLAEVYGLRQARRAIWVGFALAALASVTFLAVGAAPAGPGYENQDAFVAVLGFVPRIVLASLAGYLAGQFLNAYVLVRLKDRYAERRLAGRLVGSTVVGELADTVLFCVIAFAGVFPTWGSLIGYTITGYFYKVAVEVILLPVTLRGDSGDQEAGAGVHSRRGVRCGRVGGAAAAPGRRGRRTSTRRSGSTATGWGWSQEEQYDADGGARVMILGAGRATLELSNPAQIDYIDTVETGRTGVSPHYRVAFEVDDCAAVTDRLAAAGAELVAAPTRTPWDSLNARLQGPADVQLTMFTELAGKEA